jgi:hypothetical protein
MAMFFSCSDLTASEAMYVFDAFLQRQNVFVASHNYDRFIFELLCELHGLIAMPEALRDFAIGLDRASWVTSVRRRREDRTSISFHPLADLGR